MFIKKLLYPGILLTFFLCSNAQNQRISSYPFISGDTFRAIANHIVDETNQPFNPHQVKPYDIIFVKTDMVPHFFSQHHPLIPSQYILITHNSDLSPIFLTAQDHPYSRYSAERYLNDSKLVVWFAQNIDVVHPKLKPIPIGIANNCWPHGKISLFKHVTQHISLTEKRINKIYLNFRVTTNKAERKPVINYFMEKSYAHRASIKSPLDYLQEMKQYRYVINPPGNGLDCHRIWEALLLRCIPIMKHSILDGMLTHLPIIFVDDWTEVTPDFLDKQFSQLCKSRCSFEKAYADYWINLIKSYQQHS